TVHGGKKPLKLTDVSVKLVYVEVQTRPDQPLPSIDTRVLLSQTVAAGEDLPPGAVKTYTFRLVIPHGTNNTAHHASYKVMGVADIPGVKDPSDSADLKVVDAGEDNHRVLPIEEVFARFPQLRSPNESQLVSGLRELFLACYSEGAQFMEAEPFLADL